MSNIITKKEFLEEVNNYSIAKKERWDFLTMALTKSVKIRPYRGGTHLKGLLRSAVVTVPNGLTTQLCKEDLAMIVAGGPHYGSFRAMKKAKTDVIDPQELNKEFIVTVMLDIGAVQDAVVTPIST